MNKRIHSRRCLALLAFLLSLATFNYAQSIEEIKAAAAANPAMANEYLRQHPNLQIPVAAPAVVPQVIRREPQDTKPKELSQIEKFFNRADEQVKFNPRMGKVEEKGMTTDPVYQFGYAAFDNTTYTSSPFSSLPTGPDYVLGPGDSLQIKIWGKVEEQLNPVIDNNGQIYIAKIGQISLAGARYGDLERILKRELSKAYVNFEVSASLSKMRAIQVFVLGEVKSPGSYELSSMSTLMMALYASGGPTKMGSLRKVQLLRNRRVIRTIDLYAYLMLGDRSQDPILNNFDTIFIPVVGDVIKISGLVKRPAIFEINQSQTVQEAIEKLAGGFGVDYYGKRIQIERVVSGKKRVVTDVELGQGGISRLQKERVKNGDEIKILPISDKRFNEVTIQGNVHRPGTFEFKEGMTLEDLIAKGDDLFQDSYLKRVEIFREVNNTEREIIPLDYTLSETKKTKLKEFDIVRIYATREIEGENSIQIQGEVERPGSYKLLSKMRLSDLLFLAGPKKEGDLERAELIRKDKDGDSHVIMVNLKSVLKGMSESTSNLNTSSNIELNDQDSLVIRRNIEKFNNLQVTLTGEVKYPGRYTFLPGETIKDVILRAGGLTEKSFLSGIIFKRQSVRGLEVKGQQKILEEEQKRLFFDQSRMEAMNKAEYKGAYGNALAFLGEQVVKNDGRIVIEIVTMNDLVGAKNITLEDGDTLSIPQTPDSVQVMGGVKQNTSHIFVPGKNIQDYIVNAGGYTDFAKPDDVIIIRASGLAIKGLNQPIQKGDTIYIPEEIKIRMDWLAFWVEVTKILANVGTAFVVLKAL